MHKRTNYLFYVGWILFIFSITIRLTIWYSLEDKNSLAIILIKALRYLAYFLCLLNFITQKISLKCLLLFLLIEIFLFITSVCCGDKTMLLLSWILAGAYGTDSKKCIRIWLIMQSLFLIVIISASQMGFIEDYIFSPDLRSRHSLGFEWASIAPTIFLHCVLSYIYLHKEKLSSITIAFCGIISCFLFVFTDSKTVFAVSILTMIFFLIVNKSIVKYGRFIKHDKFFVILPINCLLLSLVVGYSYDINNLCWSKVNRIFSNRLWLQHNALKEYSISAFGQKIELIGYSVKTFLDGTAFSGYNYIDCSYLQITILYGWIFAVLIVIAYSKILSDYIKIKDNYTVLIVSIVVLISLTEPRLINFAYNPFLILLCSRPQNEMFLKRNTKNRI